MKKTVSVNIKGINFLIEEDAYELLQDYLDRLAKTLKNEDGSSEIIEDVELRIAEICSEKISESKTVIELADIESILATLGNPEDYVEDDEYSTSENTESTNSSKSERRLFRDTENATIAGVCMGIANFFNIDVVIVRAIFIVIFLFAGFGLPLYIILWIIVPKTKSTIDRLRMKGRPITVETVREEVELAADKLKTGSKKLAGRIRNDDTYKRSVSRGARIVSVILGVGILLYGLTLLVLFLVFGIGDTQFIPVQGTDGFLSLSNFGTIVLENTGDYSTFWMGALLLGSGFILFLLLLASMLIFRLYNTWAKLSLLGLFLLAIAGGIMCATVGLKTGRDFAIGAEIERVIGDFETDELIIIPQLETMDDVEGYRIKSNGKFGLMQVDEKNITLHGIHFEYVRSSDSLFHVKQNLQSRSHTHERALERSKNIHHSISLQGDTLLIDTEYTFPRADKLRNQEVEIIVEIPEGKQVRINDRIIRLGSDDFDDNISDPYYEEDGYLKANGKYRHWD